MEKFDKKNNFTFTDVTTLIFNKRRTSLMFSDFKTKKQKRLT